MAKLTVRSRLTPSSKHTPRSSDKFGVRDLMNEVAVSIGARPGRLMLTVLGTVIGIAALVVTVGLAQTAAGQINKQFDAVAATQVVVTPRTNEMGSGENAQQRSLARLPWDAEQRVTQLNGVESAGAIGKPNIGQAQVTTLPINDPTAIVQSSPSVFAVSPGTAAAIRADMIEGRFIDPAHEQRADLVAVLGVRAAERLNVHEVVSQPSVFIGAKPYTIIGIMDDVSMRSDLLDSVMIPLSTARAEFGLSAPSEVQIKIDVGAGPVVMDQAPLALDPQNWENFRVSGPPQISGVREAVQTDINFIFIALGGVALLVGGLGIANVTLLSVMERVGEIGLRRALGATKPNIGFQFLLESVIIGLLGGLIGASLGVLVVVVVSLSQSWAPILSYPMTFAAAGLGGVIGLVSGAYPAMKAASIEPITALRAGT